MESYFQRYNREEYRGTIELVSESFHEDGVKSREGSPCPFSAHWLWVIINARKEEKNPQKSKMKPLDLSTQSFEITKNQEYCICTISNLCSYYHSEIFQILLLDLDYCLL